jgi:FlgN protein
MRDAYGTATALDHSGACAELAAVAAMLWTERATLELLLFKVTLEHLVLSTGSARWLDRVQAEVQAVLRLLRVSEVVRAADAEALARRLHLPADTTLAGLAAAAPEPWPMILTDHRVALRELIVDIEVVAARNQRLLPGDSAGSALARTLTNPSLSRFTQPAGDGVLRVLRAPPRSDDRA